MEHETCTENGRVFWQAEKNLEKQCSQAGGLFQHVREPEDTLVMHYQES